MSEEHQFTSTEIFLQYCQAKPEKATAFITDYIAYNLDVSNPFDNDSYANVRQYIFDFMVACDKILNFHIIPQLSFLQKKKKVFLLLFVFIYKDGVIIALKRESKGKNEIFIILE